MVMKKSKSLRAKNRVSANVPTKERELRRLADRYRKTLARWKRTDFFMDYFEAERALRLFEGSGGDTSKVPKFPPLILEADESQPRFYKNRAGKMVKVPARTKFRRKRKNSTSKKVIAKKPTRTSTTKKKTSKKKRPSIKSVLKSDFKKINRKPISSKTKSKRK